MGLSIPYEGSDEWVDDALRSAKHLVSQVDSCPEHSEGCEHGIYLREVQAVLSSTP